MSGFRNHSVVFILVIAMLAFGCNTSKRQSAVNTPPKPSVQPLKPLAVEQPTKLEKNWEPDSTQTLVELWTNYGVMKLALFCNTSHHKENFIKLIEEHYYDSLLFHRVISGFMIQGGDPESKKATNFSRLGGGGPGYNVPAEINDENFHIKGALCAARLGDDVNPEKASSGSQFYIVHGRNVSNEELDRNERTKGITYSARQRKDYTTLGGSPQLDHEYTVFGRLYEGFEVLDKIASSPTNNDNRPKENVLMRMKIIRK